MYTGQYVFAQVMEYLPWPVFRRCVARYGGDHKIKSFSCLDQFRCLAFAQLTWRESLRDISAPTLWASLKSVSDDEGTTGGRSGPLRASKRVATSVTYTAHLSHLYYLAVCRRSKTRNMKRLFLERHFIWSDGNGPEPSTLAILLISFLP